MSQAQVDQIVGLIRALENKIDTLKDEIGQRFDYLERRVDNVEDAIVRLGGPAALSRNSRAPSSAVTNTGQYANPSAPHAAYGHPAPSGPPRQMPIDPGAVAMGSFSSIPHNNPRDITSSRAPVGSRGNAQFLPFAIEHIARKAQQKPLQDLRTCSICGSPTFALDCFRADHFRWCREHQRPILGQHRNCGRDYEGCKQVKWENHPEWETIVGMSYIAGLGKRGVNNLGEKLFPMANYPQKYDRSGRYVGAA